MERQGGRIQNCAVYRRRKNKKRERGRRRKKTRTGRQRNGEYSKGGHADRRNGDMGELFIIGASNKGSFVNNSIDS